MSDHAPLADEGLQANDDGVQEAPPADVPTDGFLPPLPNVPGVAGLPTRPVLPGEWEHIELYERVVNAIFALPDYFKPDLVISGVLATDLHSFNTSLGATIEAQAIDCLNAIRQVWDPDKKYIDYRFVRQSQQFPDVILKSSMPHAQTPILMGIELKGWFVLAKEEEPSFRYKVTPAVCAPWDLLVVCPWALSNVTSGSPKLFEPYVESARYAAEMRNYYWRNKPGQQGRPAPDNKITLSPVAHHYPNKAEKISDVPSSDTGGNFGRYARTKLSDDMKIMGEYIDTLFKNELSGIQITHWQKFLALFDEKNSRDSISRAIDRMSAAIVPRQAQLTQQQLDEVVELLGEAARILAGEEEA